MPWEETNAVEQREQFIHYWLSGCFSKTDLSARFGISRPTGDKWIERHAEEGLRGLQDRSRRPKIHPNATDAATQEAIFRTKLKHPSWGPKKVLDLLRVLHPERCWPADSTGGEILARAGRDAIVEGSPLTGVHSVNAMGRIRYGALISKVISHWVMVDDVIR